VFDGHVNDKVSLTALHRFPASQSPNCQIRVTVLNETSSPDGEHKVKLVGVMVIEASSNLNGLLGIQLDLFANKGMGELKPPEQPQPEQPQPEQPQEQPQPEQQQPPEQQQEQPQPEQPQPEQPQEQPQPEQQQPEQQVQPQQPAEQPQQRRRGRR
jgi:outer membrane biosynthesis protein TonB